MLLEDFANKLENAYRFIYEIAEREPLPDVKEVQSVVSDLQHINIIAIRQELHRVTSGNQWDRGIYYELIANQKAVFYNWLNRGWIEGETVLFQPQWIWQRLMALGYTNSNLEVDGKPMSFTSETITEADARFYMRQLFLINDHLIDIANRLDKAFSEMGGEKAASTVQPPQKPTPGRELPSELNTERARKYFERAVAAGLMSEQYKWLASQSLLACFCREMSVNLNLGKGYSSEGQKRLSWKPFEALFNVKTKNLTTSLNDIKKTGQDPIGIEKVEAIFKD